MKKYDAFQARFALLAVRSWLRYLPLSFAFQARSLAWTKPLTIALAVLCVASCGSPKPAVPNPPGERPAVKERHDDRVDLNQLDPVPDDKETNGPFLPPEIPPTVYAPYLLRSVTPSPPLPPPSNECHLAVEVRNYDGVDGCGILLETDAGNLFLVGVPPRGAPLETGTRLSIGYELMKNYEGTICANADAVIRITCKRLLRVSSGLPRPVVCEAYDKPSAWLHGLARDYSATYITRFPWDDGRYVYLLESPFGQYLYDCRGYLICKPRKNCLGFVKNISAGVIIYEG